MPADAVLRRDIVASQPIDMLSRTEVLARYRQLREIGKQHNSALLKFLSGDAIMSQARRLGLAQGKTLVVHNADDLNLVFDLVIHTASKDRSRAIDRYARVARLAPESDESVVLEAMRRAHFSIISLVRRHPVAGLIVKDVFRDDDVWLVDEGLETSFVEGMGLATRLFAPERFSMTAGVMVPLDRKLVVAALGDIPLSLRENYQKTGDDRRFAEAIYRVALSEKLTDRVCYQDAIAKSD
jgi:hypothetical protein